MPYKAGSKISVGDLIYVGCGSTVGKVIEFIPHPQLAELNPGCTGRVAVTDRGNITVIDQELISVPAE